MKRFIKALILVVTIISFVKVNAGVTNTSSYDFFVKATENEEVPADTNLDDYINSKKVNVFEGSQAENGWLNLYREESGVYKYPKETAMTLDEDDPNPSAALYKFIEQTQEQNGDDLIITNHYRISYTEVTVTKAVSTDEPTETSRVQILMSEALGNKHGTFNVTGGAFGISTNLNSSIAEFIEVGTEVTLSINTSSEYDFVGWFVTVEGTNGFEPTQLLSQSATYVFTVENPYYNIMPVFEKHLTCSNGIGHNNIWTVSGGEVAVLYEPWDLDGTKFGSGEVVNYCIGDEITVKARANDGYHFVGWFITDPAASVPENYVREPILSTNANFTYQPSVTIISGVDNPLNYVTAVFEENTSDVTTYTVSFKDGDTTLSTQTVNEGAKVTRPTTDPIKADRLFVNWYANSELSNLFDFDTPISEDISIYAKWSQYAQINIGITPNAGSWNWNVSPGDTSSINSMVLLSTLNDNQVTFTANANDGYHFVGWYEGIMNGETHFVDSHTGTLLSSNSTYTATITKYVTNVMAVLEADDSNNEQNPETYTILEGDNQVYTKGSNIDVLIKASGDKDKVIAIEIDNGNVIDPSNYELENGSTILTLKSAFLENSSVGEHTITFKYNDGEVEAKLTIANANIDIVPVTDTEIANPKTKDNVIFSVNMLFLNAVGLIGTILFKRKILN